jgi:hypothetical protein
MLISKLQIQSSSMFATALTLPGQPLHAVQRYGDEVSNCIVIIDMFDVIEGL